MPDGQSERGMDAPDLPSVSSPMKCSHNFYAGHATSDAKGTVNGSHSNAEMLRDTEPGEKNMRDT